VVPRSGALYSLQSSTVTGTAAPAVTKEQQNTDNGQTNRKKKAKQQLIKLHQQMGHRSYTAIHLLVKHQTVDSLGKEVLEMKTAELKELIDELTAEVCEGCLKGKMLRLPTTGKREYSLKPLQLVSIDIQVFSQKTHAGNMYMGEMLDVGTKLYVTTMMKRKSDIDEWVIRVMNQWENEQKTVTAQIHSDNDKAIINKTITDYLDKKGTKYTTTTSHTPQHNPIERYGRTCCETARCMMQHAGANNGMYGEALATATYLMQRSPTSYDNKRTPYERFHRKKPTYQHLHVWGCDTYVHQQRRQRE
jgi:hypothetical protein